MTRSIDIFKYCDYLSFLRDVLEQCQQDGLSIRALTRRCEISSPSLLATIANGQRRLTSATAQKLSKGLRHNKAEARYLGLLVKLERAKNKEVVREQLRSYVIDASKPKVSDRSIHSHWLYPILFELSSIEDFAMSPENIVDHLNFDCSVEEVEAALEFLLKRKWIHRTKEPNRYSQGNIDFQPLDDVRRIELQQSHFRYLDLAKHRLNDPLDLREFRGLTIAVPREKYGAISQIIRDFHKQVRKELSGYEKSDSLIRIQTCMFQVLK